MAGFTSKDCNETTIKEMGRAKMSRDQDDVRKVLSTLDNWIDPFSSSESGEICHLASGIEATEHIQRDHLTAHEKGEQAWLKYTQERLIKNNVSIYQPIPKHKLLNFSAPSKIIIPGRENVVKADRNLFAR